MKNEPNLLDDLEGIGADSAERDRRVSKQLIEIARDRSRIERLGRELLWQRIRAFAYGALLGLIVGAAMGVVVGAILW